MSNDDTLLTYITEGLSVISETMINRPLLSTAAPADAAVDGGVGEDASSSTNDLSSFFSDLFAAPTSTALIAVPEEDDDEEGEFTSIFSDSFNFFTARSPTTLVEEAAESSSSSGGASIFGSLFDLFDTSTPTTALALEQEDESERRRSGAALQIQRVHRGRYCRRESMEMKKQKDAEAAVAAAAAAHAAAAAAAAAAEAASIALSDSFRATLTRGVPVNIIATSMSKRSGKKGPALLEISGDVVSLTSSSKKVRASFQLPELSSVSQRQNVVICSIGAEEVVFEATQGAYLAGFVASGLRLVAREARDGERPAELVADLKQKEAACPRAMVASGDAAAPETPPPSSPPQSPTQTRSQASARAKWRRALWLSAKKKKKNNKDKDKNGSGGGGGGAGGAADDG